MYILRLTSSFFSLSSQQSDDQSNAKTYHYSRLNFHQHPVMLILLSPSFFLFSMTTESDKINVEEEEEKKE